MILIKIFICFSAFTAMVFSEDCEDNKGASHYDQGHGHGGDHGHHGNKGEHAGHQGHKKKHHDKGKNKHTNADQYSSNSNSGNPTTNDGQTSSGSQYHQPTTNDGQTSGGSQTQQPSTSQGQSSGSYQSDCVTNHNKERSGQGVAPLTWDDYLAGRAATAANNCCNIQPQQQHSDLQGVGQNLFIGHTTCSGAMYETNPYGWVTGEKDRNGGHWENVIGGYSKFGCATYQDSQCSCIACDYSY